MSPNASKRNACGGAGRACAVRKRQAGFSMVELMVTMVVAILLGIGVVRFYKDSYRTYSQQEQIADRNQNAHFTLSKFVEILQQAGSALPDSGWTVLKISGSVLTLGLNPRGAEQFNGVDTPFGNFIAVGDASLFASSGNVLLNTTNVLVDFQNPAKATVKMTIDAGYFSGGFSAGIKDNATGMDSIRVTAGVDLDVGDRIFGYREDQYLLSGSDLVIRPNGSVASEMVLAENIDSVGFTFRNDLGAVTTNWKLMRSASISVRARTEKPDPHLPPPGYHMITLPMNVILRNKI